MIEARLRAYRRKKRFEEMTEIIKNTVTKPLFWKQPSADEEAEPEVSPLLPNDVNEKINEEEGNEEICESESSMTTATKVTYLLSFLLWITLYIVAIEFQYGAVYFILSAFLFIWLNTGTKPKKKGEPSAYSVFNPNCKAIDGTLDASQFEREIRYGIGNVH